MKISEEVLQAEPTVFARRVGAYGAENYALMEKFKKWAFDNGHMTDEAVILGIARDDMSVTAPEKCRYDVCLLGEYDANEDWLEEGISDCGRYAVLELPHTAEAVALAWREAIPQLMNMGYTLSFERPIIERYKKSLVDSGKCEMLFPVE